MERGQCRRMFTRVQTLQRLRKWFESIRLVIRSRFDLSFRIGRFSVASQTFPDEITHTFRRVVRSFGVRLSAIRFTYLNVVCWNGTARVGFISREIPQGSVEWI